MRLASAERAQAAGDAAGRAGVPPSSPPSAPPRAAGDAGAGGGSGRLAAFALVGVLVLVLVALGAWQLTRGNEDDSKGAQGQGQGGITATDTVDPDSGPPIGIVDDDATETPGVNDEDAAATHAVRAATAAVVPSEASANPGDAGEPTPTTDPGSGSGEDEPTATPEGEGEGEEVANAASIVFATSRDSGDGTLDLWTMSADGQAQTPLITLPHDDWSPAWSPDGSMLAWSNKTDGQQDDIWIANADGTGAWQVTTALGDDRFPTWSPDSAHILFVRTIDGNDEIIAFNVVDRIEQQMTYNEVYDGYAAWSPDGTRIAWTSGEGGSNNIWLMTTDGSNYPASYSEANDYSPVWVGTSGEYIFYVTERDGNQDIYVMESTGGGNQEPIAATPQDEFYPRVSPDLTSYLAYVRRQGDVSENRGELVIVRLSDGTEQVLANNVLMHDPGLVWAPDGSGLLFQRQSADTYVDLWWANLAGDDPVQLTNSALYDGGASWRGTYP